jgi:carbamoyltransferase
MSIWVAGVARGHNSSVCLLKDGEIVFTLEEERLSRKKYDGGPLAAMIKILEYTDRLDYLVVAHTQPLEDAGKIDFTGDDIYTGLARKLGLIDRYETEKPHPQVIDLSYVHHKLHAACAFYRSGFSTAASVIVDGAGTFIPMNFQEETIMTWELESIFSCSYPDYFKTEYKHQGSRGPHIGARMIVPSDREGEQGEHELVIDDTGGIVKAYEAVTQYCGWAPIEAGKTMGLSPYGKENKDIPNIYDDAGGGVWRTTNRNLIIPTFPNGAAIAETRFSYLNTQEEDYEREVDLTEKQNRRDLAYAVQSESQQEVLALIEYAVEKTGNNNVVLSGGYGLNCVANYWYLDNLKDKGINLYVEPISNDAGTAIGAAMLIYHSLTKDTTVKPYADSLYLGPVYNYSQENINLIIEKYDGAVKSATVSEVTDILMNKNIVSIFQGRSEAGPRALGNRSLLFDPRVKDGKNFVNKVKRREYFRPFAATILWEYVHDWFDLKNLNESPHMMYAVNCMPGTQEEIPSVVHIDGTCRIQTLKQHQNPNYYDLIQKFYEKTKVPILFNTSFNLGGEPLVETLDDAVRTLYNSDIEYLYLPEYELLIEVKN